MQIIRFIESCLPSGNIKIKMPSFFYDIISLSLLSVFLVFILSTFSDSNFNLLIKEFFRPILKVLTGEYSLFTRVVLKSIPLWLTALTFSIPLKSGYFNIGGEGQLIISSFTCVWLIHIFSGIYKLTNSLIIFYIFISMLVSIIVGIVWALIPYILKRVSQVNEVITSLVLNYLAVIIIVGILNYTDIADSNAQGIQSGPISSNFLKLVTLNFKTNTISILAPLCFILLITLSVWLWKTRSGLHLRAVGINRKAADIMGLKSQTIIIISIVIAGACAAFGGINNTLTSGRFSIDGLRGLGFDGIVVAILGKFNASGIIIASIFLALWYSYDYGLQTSGFPHEISLSAQAIFLIVFLTRSKKR